MTPPGARQYHGAMTNMQRAVVVLAFIFAILLGILLATTLLGEKPASSPTASPSGALASPSASGSSSPSGGSASASAAPSASPTPSPSPTLKPGVPATISFVQLALDAATDSNGTTRIITAVAEPGPVTVKLTTESGGNTQACLLADGQKVGCRTGITMTLTATNAKKTSKYQITLRGAGAATPIVTVTMTYPATKPKVTITNARFDGTDFPTTNGLQVVATPRAKGTYQVSASWGGHPFLYEVDLIEQGGPGLKTVVATTSATKVTQGFAITKDHPWMIVLKNSENGFGPTPLTATFTWP